MAHIQVFVSFSHHHGMAHHLMQALLEEDFVNNCDNAVEAAEDQTILARAFKAVVDGWRERKHSSRLWSPLDPRQVVRAHFVAAWRYLHELELDDTEFHSLCNDIESEVLALKYVCDPDD